VLGHPDSSATGLSAQEAPPRLAADGPNALKEGKQISPLRIFIGTNETGTLTSGEMRNRPL
jgi:Ca2+-transporting ATPase